jgi:hypothetical protein
LTHYRVHVRMDQVICGVPNIVAVICVMDRTILLFFIDWRYD